MSPRLSTDPLGNWPRTKRFHFKRPIIWVACLPAAVLVLPLLLTLSFPDLLGGTPGVARSKQPLLLITAHPDDEVVFFGPSVAADRPGLPHPSLLCLSTGNAWGKGQIRRQELAAAAASLQVDVHVMDLPSLQDGKNETWREQDVAQVMTFDEEGVTQHPNHMATFRGVRHYLQQCAAGEHGSPLDCPAGVKLLTLRSLYQRLGPLSVLPAALEARWQGHQVHVHHALWRSFAAMAAHRTQAHWWSHLLTSPYTYVNTFAPILPVSSRHPRHSRLRVSYRRTLHDTVRLRQV